MPSKAAREAAEAFAQLIAFFRTPSQLRQALEWSAPTLRSWVREEGPARPRVDSTQRVLRLLRVAKAAARWVSDPWYVGDWMVEPQPSLSGLSPAGVVARLSEEGTQLLVEKMAFVAPRERIAPESPEVDLDALRETLRRLGAPEIAPVAPSDTVDLPDFD